jgi:hypothetical protein
MARDLTQGVVRARRLKAAFGAGSLLISAVLFQVGATNGADASPASTTSYYESSVSSATLSAQGVAAGRSGAQGIVILDFGRPANNGLASGTIDFAGTFVSLDSVRTAAESFVSGYFQSAPANTTLDVALGTNNSCGTGQPCEGIVCGCIDEPPSYLDWGVAFADAVEAANSWAASYRGANGMTDTVRVIAADDAEPGFDPGYANTYDVLQGYAATVGGTFPPLVDYGSAEGNIWTESQLYQVAYGFAPDVPMPEIYYPTQVADWTNLLSYANHAYGRAVTFYGVLTQGLGTNTPQVAYEELMGATVAITGQQSLSWSSTISH